MINIPEQYQLTGKGKAKHEAIVKGEHYRFTVLTPSFIRMEYSEHGFFEDRPTKIIQNRELEVPDYRVTEKEDKLEIRTSELVLIYDLEKPFSRESLMIKFSTNAIHGLGVWRYGFEPLNNLKGTYRTLDEADGAVPLDDGLFSEEGYTIIDDSKSIVFNEDGWFEKRPEETIDLYYFGYGNRFEEGLKAYYTVSGHTPLIPRYALGNWWSRYWEYNQEELYDLLDTFEAKKIPLSVCIVDMDWHTTNPGPKYGSGWTGYSWNKDLFKDPKVFIDGLHRREVKTSLNLHPALGFRGHEDCYESFATFMDMDKTLEEPIDFDPVNPKFMEGYFKYGHHPHEDDGVDFWWIDWQQGNNTKVEGIDPLYLLNHYHFMDHGRNEDIRPFIFSRWAGLGSHRYPIGFSGDSVVSWDSLKFQPEFTSTAANVGYGWWSHDIGGHFNGIEEDELYTRWVQFGVFSPIMRLHTSKNYYSKREPWRFSKESELVVTKFMQLRHAMVPYIYTTNYKHANGGLPLITPMYYRNQNQHQAQWEKESYMFGEELMVAPFLEAMDYTLQMAKRNVWFPEGSWFDFFTGKAYGGNKSTNVYGTLADMPVFAKAGAIIPMAELDGHHGVENPSVINVNIFPGNNHSYCLYEDDGISQKHDYGAYLKTTISTEYQKQNDKTKLKISIKSDGDKKVIPVDRKYRLALRSFKKPINTDAYTYDDKSRTLWLDTAFSGDEITVELYFDQEAIDLSYDPTKDIMKAVDRTKYRTYDKISVGYRDDAYLGVRGGILGEDCSVTEKIEKIAALSIAPELKSYVITMLSQSK